jgi:hypothetical protein
MLMLLIFWKGNCIFFQPILLVFFKQVKDFDTEFLCKLNFWKLSCEKEQINDYLIFIVVYSLSPITSWKVLIFSDTVTDCPRFWKCCHFIK